MSGASIPKLRALASSWLLLDFFGEARRTGAHASTLTTTIFSQSFLSLVVAALIYPEPPPVPFAAAMLCLSSLLIALGALDTEHGLARRRADRVLLGTAPIRRLQAAAARALHAAFRTMLLTIGMALPPGILLACRQHDLWLTPAYLLAACLSSALCAGSLAVLLQAGRRVLGSTRTALLAGTAKALLLGFGLVLFLQGLPALQKTADELPLGRLGAQLLPPYHLAKVLAAPLAEGYRLLPLLGAGALLLMMAAAIGERERDGRGRAQTPSILDRLALSLARSPHERGLVAFCTAMLWRSASFRSHALPLLGIPAAIAYLSLGNSDPKSRELFLGMALQFPAIYLPFVIAFLPRNDFAGAAWVFASAPSLAPATVQRATWLSLVTHVLLPVHALAWLALGLAGAPLPSLLGAGGFALGVAILAARPMVRALSTLPFSRDGADAPFEIGSLMYSTVLLGGAGAAFALAPWQGRIALLVGVLITALSALLHAPKPPKEPAGQEPLVVATGDSPGEAKPKRANHASNQGKPLPPQSLRRELYAICFLFAVVAILPLLIGIAFAPKG